MNYLYNGVEFPQIPEWDRETYPYAFIFELDDIVFAYYANETFSRVEEVTGGEWFRPTSETVSFQYYSLNENEWRGGWTDTRDDIGASLVGRIIWANYDIVNDENGTIYLAASDPIPVTPQPTPPRRRYNPMSRKGGYKIINLGDADLSTDPVIEGIYDAIEGNYRKRLVLSGLTVGAIEYPDLEIEVSLSGQDFTFAAYGNTITITPEDVVSVN